MSNPHPPHIDLQATAKDVMMQRGFRPDFPPEVRSQLQELKKHPPQVAPGKDVRDLRNLLWSSIDNDTSRDLDQIEVAERGSNGEVKVLIGIADVDSFVSPVGRLDRWITRAVRGALQRMAVQRRSPATSVGRHR